MSKRKAEVPQPAQTLPPAQRLASLQPDVTHCQPARYLHDFAKCFQGQCGHCTTCILCQAKRYGLWQRNEMLRTVLAKEHPALKIKADAYEERAPTIARDQEAHDQINALQNQLSALQQQFNDLQNAFHSTSQLQQELSTRVEQREEGDAEEALGGVVRKYENVIEEPDLLDGAEPFVEDGRNDGLPSSAHTYDTAQSTFDDLKDDVSVKREDTPEVDQFALIDQIPSSGHRQRPRPRQGIVVIDLEEQIEARKSLEQLRPSVERQPTRQQPHRDSTLYTPRPSIEGSNERKSGSLWTQEEDRKLRKGVKKSLNPTEISHRYLPHRSSEGIRKRKAKLNLT